MKKDMKKISNKKTSSKFNYLKSKEFTINLSFFIFLLFVFMFQFPNIGDDFKVYILNGEFLMNKYFKAGLPNFWYFEPQRPLLVPMILGFIEMFFNIFIHQPFILRTLAIFIFYLINILIFIYALNSFSKSFKVNRILLFSFMISSYFLSYSLLEGTEMLSLSFLILALAKLIERKNSGIFFALAMLTRFDFLIFFPFIFSSLFFPNEKNEKTKRFFSDLSSFLGIFLIYGLYTFLIYKIPFLPIIDSFFFSSYLQEYLFQKLSFAQFSSIAIFFFPSLISIVLLPLIQKKKFFNEKNNIMLILFIIVIAKFYFTPFKIERYFFPLVLPCSYFLSSFFEILWNNLNKKTNENHKNSMKLLKISLIFLIIIYLIYNILDYFALMRKNNSYLEEENKLFTNTLMQISYDKPLETNYHVAIIFLTQNYGIFHKVYPMLRYLNFNETLECYNVLLFYPSKKPDWKEEYQNIEEKLKFIDENINVLKNDYVIFLQKNSNQNCTYEKYYDYTILQKLKKRIPDLSYLEMLIRK
ncbi:MAG: hypothetical protein QXR30_02360 [Candidatus Woesearchaeota archaeon]